MMDKIRVPLASESHPSEADHHYTFSPECLDKMVEQAKGLPVTINFDGDPVVLPGWVWDLILDPRGEIET